ncbi:hypothetical protein GGR30_000307 [Martelella radicis]|uniref:DUF1989 domain-containing protein n=2 Tax=Martelella radicis TaxID=1397476 RepID=A0A7W6P7Q0_9HYPH|nr:hypothetical protein [Martelella radicis]
MTETMEITKVPARRGRMIALDAGDLVDIVNVHGGQVVDTWAFARDNPAEYMSMEHSHVLHYRLNFRPGDALCTDNWRTIMTFVEDTSPGIHDTLCPACCEPSYNIFYGHEGYHDNCSDNLKGQFEELGVPFHRVPTPWNLFMETIVENSNDLKDMPSTTRPGQYVRLRAEIDCYFAVSACPQDLIVINGDDGVPRDVELHVRRAGSRS